MAQRRSITEQAKRVRRLPSRGRVPHRGEVHEARAHHHTGRLQRRAAGGRVHQPAARPVWRCYRASRVSVMMMYA